jgi:hypothetical protein
MLIALLHVELSSSIPDVGSCIDNNHSRSLCWLVTGRCKGYCGMGDALMGEGNSIIHIDKWSLFK